MSAFDSQLRQLQLTMLEMLKMVDSICRENNIQYSLCSGTLIGAVRHKGFIPWDDDLDIRMTRENYDKFLEVWEQIQPEGYFLQNKENSPNFPSSFSKIRKNNTSFVTNEWEKGQFHTGIFIDIFPLDRIPTKWFQKTLFKYRSIKYQIYTRENFHTVNNWLVKAPISLLMKITSPEQRMKYRKKFIDGLKVLDKNKNLNRIGIEIPSMLNKPFSPDVAEKYIDIDFEDGKFMCFSKWEEYLHILYGDYMQLPPLEEREWKHHPIILDFEHSWEELNEEEK